MSVPAPPPTLLRGGMNMYRNPIKLTLFSALLLSFTMTASAQAGTDPSDPAAIDVLEKYIAATGGREAWSAIKTRRETSEMAIMNMTRKRTLTTDRANGRVYERVDQQDGVVENGFDGKRVWERTPFFHGYLKDDDPKAKAFRKNGKGLVNYRESGRVFHRAAAETVDGRPEIVLTSEEEDPFGRLITARYFFDSKSFLLDRVVRGGVVSATTAFEDYRRTSAGVLVPFVSRSITPQITVVSRTTSWEANIPVQSSMFEFGETAAEEQPQPPAAKPAASTATPVARDGEISEADRVATFTHAWEKVRDTYWDPAFGGVDWQHVRDEFLPRVKAAKTSRDFHLVLNEMVGQLGRSHFRVLPPEKVVSLHSHGDTLPDNAGIGMKCQWIDDQLVVTELDAGYPAAQAGVQKGWVVQRVNGSAPPGIYEKELKQSTGYHLRKEVSLPRAVNEVIAGPVSQKVELDFLDSTDKPVHLTISRKARPLSEQSRVTFESKRLRGGVGYIRFDLFFGDALEKFEQAIHSMSDAPALIVDLRGNPGGAGDMSVGIAALLARKAGSLGTSHSRYGKRDFSYEPAAGAFKGDVFVLTDERSGSTVEVLSGGLQGEHRATIVGAATAGAVLPSLIEPLQTGGALVYVVSDFRAPNGAVLEGAGVHPDVQAHIHRADLLAGRDPVVEQATALALHQ